MNRVAMFVPNWLGDAVMALPAIEDVRRASPGVTIAVAARPAIAPFFHMVAGVTEVIALERRVSTRAWASLEAGTTAWRKAGTELRDRGFDVALLFPNSFHAAFIAWRAGIPERWGYRTAWRGGLLTRAVDCAPAGVHQVDRYQQLVRGLGFPNGPIEPRLDVSEELRAGGRRALVAAGWDGATPVVAIAPGAAYGGAKRWPPEHFAAAVRLYAAEGIRTVMVGSAADAPTGHQIESALGDRSAVLNAIGTDLPTLVGLLANVATLISNDSGAMHLGAAIGVSVMAVFGPTDERATGPRSGRGSILAHPVWCRPCALRECPLDHRCMRGISVEAVFDAARRSL